MNSIFAAQISEALQIPEKQVLSTIELLKSGATIPFISRYRKECTGGLNEVQVASILDKLEKLTELKARKESIIKAIEKKQKLTPELKERIEASWNSNEIEDLYLPFKTKQTKRSETARQHGLEPLAKMLAAQKTPSLPASLHTFVKGEVKNEEEALKGARDIIAEWVNENNRARSTVRFAFRKAIIRSKVIKGKEEEGAKYNNYFQFEEKLSHCQSHRLLAIRRGEAEGFLQVSIVPEEEPACLESLCRIFRKRDGECWEQVKLAVQDAYKRLLKPAIESEYAQSSKRKADEEAIRVFAENLRQLLLAPPLGQKRVLGIDPGFRTGCKLVCLDAQGNLLHNETIYPHPPRNERKIAERKLQQLVETYRIEAISIGNGTASRETEQLVANIRYTRPLQVFVVSEDGASIYSASPVARAEFPDYDITVRGAVSIGRRLMDPLAELVKIDPKSIGVGQYQHTVDQTLLKKSLDQTVESCVNLVGVNVNTASKELLTYISGLGPALAQNIVDYRAQNGAFSCREELKKVPRLGNKAFEQCAGFLRIPNGSNPLDNSAVHPESYSIVQHMADDLHCTIDDLMHKKSLRVQIVPENYIDDRVGLPTLRDILQELDKPGRDPRNEIKEFSFSPDIHSIEDLKEGMILPGIVTNITNFGCFVDIGLKENGLVHISELSDSFVNDPSTIVSLHQHIQVRVLHVDLTRKRIQLSMKQNPQSTHRKTSNDKT